MEKKCHNKGLLFKSNARAIGQKKTGIMGISRYRLTFEMFESQ